MIYDDRMPRLVVVTCRPEPESTAGWVLELDFGDDVDIWAARAYLVEAITIIDEQLGTIVVDE